MRFRFNEIYEPVFATDKRMIDVWGGRGRGGSHFVTDHALFMITQPYYFRGAFVRQTFADIRDSLFRDFKDRVEENQTIDIDNFHIDESKLRITYEVFTTGNNPGEIIKRYGDHIDAIELHNLSLRVNRSLCARDLLIIEEENNKVRESVADL